MINSLRNIFLLWLSTQLDSCGVSGSGFGFFVLCYEFFIRWFSFHYAVFLYSFVLNILLCFCFFTIGIAVNVSMSLLYNMFTSSIIRNPSKLWRTGWRSCDSTALLISWSPLQATNVTFQTPGEPESVIKPFRSQFLCLLWGFVFIYGVSWNDLTWLDWMEIFSCRNVLTFQKE